MCSDLATITGIDPSVLRGQHPTTRTVAERMSWASSRSTTRVEDKAYSLMGLFNVFMPMLYGEGDRAFFRLQEEILKQTEDHTMFGWMSASSQHTQRGLLAKSPSEFQAELSFDSWDSSLAPVFSRYRTGKEYHLDPARLTSRGVLIGLPLSPQQNARTNGKLIQRNWAGLVFTRGPRSEIRPVESITYTHLALICHLDSTNDDPSQIVCIKLRKLPGRSVFSRVQSSYVLLFPEDYASAFTPQLIYVISSGSVNE